MFKKIGVALLVAVMCITLITPAVFADDTPGYLNLTGEYLLDGDIDWRIIAGSVDTGAIQKTIVEGKGSIDRKVAVDISLGKLTVTEDAFLKSYDNLKMISAVKVGFGAADAVYDTTDQIYAWYLKPDPNEFAYVGYAFNATDSAYKVDDESLYIDSFVIDFEGQMSKGTFARYISMSSGIAKSPYVDDLAVHGQASIKETLEVFDVLKPLKSFIDWYNLF